jgi:hypothetical protein
MENTKSLLARRKLLIGLGGAAVAAVALMARPFRTLIATASRQLVRSDVQRRLLLSLANAGFDAWHDQIGTTFTVGGGSGLKLVDVSAIDSAGPRPLRLTREGAFLAKFDVQNGGTMAGDLIYTAMHPRYGAFMIFLSASSDPNLPHRMTALFN